MITDRVTLRSVTGPASRINIYKQGFGPDRYVVPYVNFYYPPIFDHTDVIDFSSFTSTTVASYYYKNSTSTPGWRDLHRKKVSQIKKAKGRLERSAPVPRYAPPKLTFRGGKNFSTPSGWPQPINLLNSFPNWGLKDLIRFYYSNFLIKVASSDRTNMEYNLRQLCKLALYRRDFLRRTASWNKQALRREQAAALLKKKQQLNVVQSRRTRLMPENPYTEFFIQFIGSSRPYLMSVTDQYFGTSVRIYRSMLYQLNDLSVSDAPSARLLMRSTIGGIKATLSPITDEMEGRLSRKFWDKLSDQKIHVGNIVAERVKTMDSLTSIFQRILSVIRSKKSLFKSLSSYLTRPKSLSGDFLAFKFGIEPLYKDLMSTAEKLYDLNSEQEMQVTVRTLTRRVVNTQINGLDVKGTISIAYVVKYGVALSDVRTLQELGLVNPAEILWEITPWSFVVDWILPIGNFINQFTADCGLTFLTGTRTVRYNLTVRTIAPAIHHELSHGSTMLYGDYYLALKDREVLTGPPNRFEFGIKSPFSWTHAAESFALLIQRLKK